MFANSRIVCSSGLPYRDGNISKIEEVSGNEVWHTRFTGLL